jgi:hypothetical protein
MTRFSPVQGRSLGEDWERLWINSRSGCLHVFVVPRLDLCLGEGTILVDDFLHDIIIMWFYSSQCGSFQERLVYIPTIASILERFYCLPSPRHL